MPSLSSILTKIKIRLGSKYSEDQMVYVVYGKQPSPFPDLEYIEPIIAIVASERECFAIQEKYLDTKVSWEARKVQGAESIDLVDGCVLYLTHTTLSSYDEDADGNPIFGIMENPQPTALYCSRDTAEQQAPEQYLHIVTLGEINLRGVGELLE
ncbi:hypothetical protein CQ010_16815 [Arthrobacter sp. MYb211]|uniref:hypothetical protein n=1 Tax=Micrococcaceae TaxID=1268 RepID=UPI000BB9668E|nr:MULTISPECIES: hypothetical protein [Micrococcaceae]PCC27832.1 hypothetical protein CIK76_14815 [Glutamicibacter sp. BW80]PRA09906.1 hypothetical protein CQ015_16800 [Arthrobacter sp. MYb221]PRC04914.1 hypothetical protein CQ010_16815 [Arthrobacter sp. MYb211]